MKSHSASITLIVSGTTNSRYLIRECLEPHPFFNYLYGLRTQPCLNQRQGFGSYPTTSNSFTNISNIFNVLLLLTKVSVTGHLLYYRYCYCLRIKDLTLAACSLYGYTKLIVVCMILTNKERLEPDIWPGISQQAKSIEGMMRTIWNIETI